MNTHTFLLNVGVALLAALAGGLVARALRLPVLIGYLVAGIVVGPHTPGIIARTEAVAPVAQLGVALLMFTVGVHFSLDQLRSLWRTAVIGGGLQILATTLLGLVLGIALGWGTYGGLFLGCALSLSSTAVMMKVLEERGEIATAHGTVMLAVLIVQDLSLVLMVVLLPALSLASTRGAAALSSVGVALLKAVLFLAVTLLLAMRGVPALMHLAARMGSRELFLLLAVCLCLVAGMAAEYAGLGLELGAFIAGIVLSEGDYAHEVSSQVRPLRDVFASLFFVSIGMLLQPAFLVAHWLEVGLVVAAIVLGKSLLTALIVFALGWHGGTSIKAGLGLAQIGEFSFVLATVGSARGLIAGEIANVILSAALITLLLAPFLFGAAGPLYALMNRAPAISQRLNRQGRVEESAAGRETPRARVLILGYGRIGRYVSNALHAKGVAHIVVDYDVSATERLEEPEIVKIYGDATSETVLEQAHPRLLALSVIALPDAGATEMALRLLKRLNPDMAVVARVHRGLDIPRMRAAGADAVIHAEFEAATEMVRQTMARLGVPDNEIAAYIGEVREQRYRHDPA